jgi:hypothetical protein
MACKHPFGGRARHRTRPRRVPPSRPGLPSHPDGRRRHRVRRPHRHGPGLAAGRRATLDGTSLRGRPPATAVTGRPGPPGPVTARPNSSGGIASACANRRSTVTSVSGVTPRSYRDTCAAEYPVRCPSSASVSPLRTRAVRTTSPGRRTPGSSVPPTHTSDRDQSHAERNLRARSRPGTQRFRFPYREGTREPALGRRTPHDRA